jgi:YHS domain-containing protein
MTIFKKWEVFMTTWIQKVSTSVSTSLVLAMVALLLPQAGFAQESRMTTEYNLQQNGIGLHGYDPVAVFPEGGGQPQMGVPQFSLNYEGVTYMFASCEHMEMFKAAPQKYEPTYGGWCAYAMASGSKVDIQPTLFTIHGNRAHYFVAARAKANFDRDVAGYEMRADSNWKQISGEEPRQ